MTNDSVSKLAKEAEINEQRSESELTSAQKMGL